ncbi:MAG: ATP-binding protein [Candidatus Binatia bacterium]
MRNRSQPWLSLRLRVIMVTIGLQVVFIATFGGIQVYNEYRSMREFVRDSSLTFASCIAHTSRMVLSTGDRAMLARSLVMAQQQHGDDIKYVIMHDREGKVLASTLAALSGITLTDAISRRALESERLVVQEPRDEGSPPALYEQCTYDIAVPIVDNGSRVGTLRLGVSARGIHQRVWAVISRGAWMAGLALLAGGILAVAVDRKMQRSFRELIRVTRSIAGGDLSQRVNIDTGDELQDLGQTFNVMTEQLAASRDELRRWGGALEEKVGLRTQELEEERQKLNGIVSGIGAGLLLLDHDLRVQWANGVACGWFGPLSALVGTACFESLWKEAGRCDTCAAARALTSGQVEQCERILETPAGERRFLQITSSPIRNQRGEVMQVVELIQDVTEKRHMEQQLLQASKMVAIGELAAAVAHEITNPLAVIGAHVERMQRLLRNEHRDGHFEKLPAYLETTQRHVYRCKETIDKLLGFARHKDPQIQPVDLNQVLQEAAGLVASGATVSGVRVVTDLATRLPALQSDPHGLVQVFVNLLTNALDACGGSGEIRVSSRAQGHALVAEVADTGRGIPPEHLTAIFQPFFTTKPEGKGTGLGLPICMRIVSRLGGQLTVRSASGAGTTFTVTLPLPMNPQVVSA